MIVPVRVIENRPLSNGLFWLALERPAGWDYVPGQFARLGFPQEAWQARHPGSEVDENGVWRAYSLASHPSDDTLCFVIKHVEGGMLSPTLAQLQFGDTVYLDGQAQGNLAVDRIPGGTHLVMMATSSGIAPFLSQLKDHAMTGDTRKPILVVGTKTHAEAVALEALAHSIHPDAIVITSASRDIHPLTGRLTEHLQSGHLNTLLNHTWHPETSRILLCGNPDFIRETRAFFKELGIVSPRFGKPGQLLVEALW